jgi:hypothetical protein
LDVRESSSVEYLRRSLSERFDHELRLAPPDNQYDLTVRIGHTAVRRYTKGLPERMWKAELLLTSHVTPEVLNENAKYQE